MVDLASAIGAFSRARGAGTSPVRVPSTGSFPYSRNRADALTSLKPTQSKTVKNLFSSPTDDGGDGQQRTRSAGESAVIHAPSPAMGMAAPLEQGLTADW
ncbi:hypothetical protein GCM10022402_47600 [Salinactinospora qingdaonensis]|uniref:Uncharacterized protein n=1 Tax=Salinactinospora qingdaonensis TaxID=702744 RepID=A0ABP7GGW4_9ACTN